MFSKNVCILKKFKPTKSDKTKFTVRFQFLMSLISDIFLWQVFKKMEICSSHGSYILYYYPPFNPTIVGCSCLYVFVRTSEQRSQILCVQLTTIWISFKLSQIKSFCEVRVFLLLFLTNLYAFCLIFML